MEEKAQKPSKGKKVLNFFFNIFWALFCGIELAIGCLFAGFLSCLLILPIFFGVPLVYWKLMALVFAPAGKRVVLNFEAHPVRNVFYYIFGGGYKIAQIYVYGALLCCTLIGIPLGLQVFKFGKYFLAPFGAEVYDEGEIVLRDTLKK